MKITSSFNERDVRTFYRFLNLREYDVRIVRGPVAAHKFIHSEDEFVDFCIRYNGVRNIYCGINQRREGGTKSSDVISVNNLLIDIDPVRARGTRSTPEQIKLAKERVGEIVEYFRASGFISPSSVFSGNGYHLYSALKPIEVTDANRDDISKKMKIFGNMLRRRFSDNKVRIDNTFDLARVAGVPGTLSIKHHPILRVIEGEMIRREDKKLSKEILNTKPPEQPLKHHSYGKLSTDEGTLDYALKVDKKFRDLFNGITDGFPSRSEAELALALKSMFYHLDPSFVLSMSGIGKWNSETENYRKRTLDAAERIFRGDVGCMKRR